MNFLDDILMHYGVKRRSGRYPWGSGDNPYQHSGDFLSRIDELKKSGKTDKEIAQEASEEDDTDPFLMEAIQTVVETRTGINIVYSKKI